MVHFSLSEDQLLACTETDVSINNNTDSFLNNDSIPSIHLFLRGPDHFFINLKLEEDEDEVRALNMETDSEV